MTAAARDAAGVHILVVDDDLPLQRTVAEYLEREGFSVSVAASRQQASSQLAGATFSLMVLDLRLGRDDGLDLLRAVRTDGEMPIIVVTGHRRDEVDRILGLELGADDYLLKPFSLRELLARIRTVLRRVDLARSEPARPTASLRARFDGWTFDRRARRLLDPAGQVVGLSKSEFALLSAFVDAPGRPLSREFLIQATRMHEDVFDRSIDVQILRLRRKLEVDPSDPRLIKTERGFGYTFAPSVEILR